MTRASRKQKQQDNVHTAKARHELLEIHSVVRETIGLAAVAGTADDCYEAVIARAKQPTPPALTRRKFADWHWLFCNGRLHYAGIND